MHWGSHCAVFLWEKEVYVDMTSIRWTEGNTNACGLASIVEGNLKMMEDAPVKIGLDYVTSTCVMILFNF